MKSAHVLALCLTIGGFLTVLSPAWAGDNVGTSTADLPSYVAKFTLTNNSGLNVGYDIKWGDGPWKGYTLEPGHNRSHWINVTNGRYPTPHIRFNNVAGTNSEKGYKMEGYEVGYNGFGSGPAYATTPKLYHFENTANDNTVDLFNDN